MADTDTLDDTAAEATPPPLPKPDATGELPERFTDEDLAILSDEERSAVLADQKEDEDADARAAEEQEAERQRLRQEIEADVRKDIAAEPASAEPQVPDTTEARKKLETAEAELDALLDSFDSGDLTAAEYREKQKAILEGRDAARAEISHAESVVNEAKRSAEQAWFDEVKKYTAERAALISDEHLMGFDAVVRRVNSDSALLKLPAQTRLALAHEQYASIARATGNPLPDDIAAPVTPQQPKRESMQARTDERDDIPPTLASVPQSDVQGVNDGRFAAIDRAIDEDPAVGEAAFARLSEEEQERYLRGEV